MKNSWKIFGRVIFGALISQTFYGFVWITVMRERYPHSVFLFIPEFWRPLFLYCVMLLGMIFNVIYEDASYEFSKGVRKLQWKRLRQRVGSHPRLWMALTVSPIVYYVTYIAVKEFPTGIIAWFYAFQNGFFWQSVTSGVKRKVEATTKET